MSATLVDKQQVDAEEERASAGYLEPARLFELIDKAQSKRNIHLGRYEKLLEQIAGESWTEGRVTESEHYDPDSFALEYVSIVLPKLAYSNPRVSARPKTMSLTGRRVGLELGYALTEWCDQVGFEETLQRCALDWLIGFSVTLIADSAVPWITDLGDPELPRAYRISPKDFVVDPAAKHPSEASFFAHRFVATKASVLAHAEANPGTWDVEAVRGLKSAGDQTHAAESDERLVEVWHVWQRDPAGRKPGTVCCLARCVNPAANEIRNARRGAVKRKEKGDTGDYVMPSREYRGRRCGPYVLSGWLLMGSSPYPVGPLLAIDRQIQENARSTHQTTRANRSYRKKLLTTDKNADLAAKMARCDTWAEVVETLDPETYAVVEVGGIQTHHVAMQEQGRQRLERASGLHDVRRGNLRGDTTATAVAVAEGASSTRDAGLNAVHRRGVMQVLHAVGWHLWYDAGAAIPIGGEDATRKLGRSNATFERGRTGEYERMALSIEPYSMERVDSAIQQRKALLALQIVNSVAPAMPATPWVKWREGMTEIGDMVEIDFSRWFDWTAIASAGGASRGGASRGGGGGVEGAIAEAEGGARRPTGNEGERAAMAQRMRMRLGQKPQRSVA